MRRLAAPVLLALAAGGCVSSTPPTGVHQPMTARPAPRMPAAVANGAIYQVASARPLFEDRRARFVGDTLVIQLAEKTQASKKSSTAADRSQKVDVSVPTLLGVPGKSAQGMSVSAASASNFSGKGDTDAMNDFTGTITVTVIETLANGNLLVSGEKQIAINQGQEFVRFSGVVNPIHIAAGNTVQSTQVADARIEYKASGFLNEAQVMGWLARFFLTVLPF
ncbi:MAG: flagellar basal body L-ring protein FlgH [Rhodocyclaceae bacterium]